jgi:hypothetical protein
MSKPGDTSFRGNELSIVSCKCATLDLIDALNLKRPLADSI